MCVCVCVCVHAHVCVHVGACVCGVSMCAHAHARACVCVCVCRHLDKVRTVLARCRPIISGLREQGEGGKEGASAAHGTSGSGMTSSLTGQESTSRKTVGEEAMDTVSCPFKMSVVALWQE